MKLSFIGGIRLPYNKNTSGCPIEDMPSPKKVYIPLSQQLGGECVLLVKKGDIVDKGQIIGDVEDGNGCPVHASVSGVVESLEVKKDSAGKENRYIVIANDFEERLSKDIMPINQSLESLTINDVIEITRLAGIGGIRGDSYPIYTKLKDSVGKIKHLIVNCVESEPYITINNRLLLENSDKVLNGLKILLKVFGLPKGYIAIEDTKGDAIDLLEEKTAESDLFDVRVLKAKYPQDNEKQIIYALTGKELAVGQRPFEVGCLVINAETLAYIYDAVVHGMPLIERVVTVDGDCIRDPKNLRVKIGTLANELIDYCGGLVKDPNRIIFGDTMTGVALNEMYAPIEKDTLSVLVFSKENKKRVSVSPTCIRCGRCVNNCPMRLMPNYLAIFAKLGEIDKCCEFDILSCIECGVCSYSCPAGVPITETIRATKAKVFDKIKKEQEEKAKEPEIREIEVIIDPEEIN